MITELNCFKMYITWKYISSIVLKNVVENYFWIYEPMKITMQAMTCNLDRRLIDIQLKQKYAFIVMIA